MLSALHRLYRAVLTIFLVVRQKASEVSWRDLIRVQRVVLGRALFALPLIGGLVAASPTLISHYFVGKPGLHFVFWGALIFMAGQVLVWLRQPIEFKGELDTPKIMDQINLVTTTLEHSQNRARMLRNVCDAASKEDWPGLDRIKLLIASQRASESLTEANWKDCLPGIEISIRAVMDYSRPAIRQTAVWLSAIGIIIMMAPTAYYGLCTALLLLSSYLHWALGLLK
jgi:hypothetical protein